MPFPVSTVRLIPALTLVGVAVAIAAATGGGDRPDASALCLATIGLAGLIWAAGAWWASDVEPPAETISHTDILIVTTLLLFPAYVAFQLLPLPLWLLSRLSPARAEITEALGAIGALPAAAPLSVAPATTAVHLFRGVAYVVTFLVARDAVRRAGAAVWWAAVPLVAIGAWEAVSGLVQSATLAGMSTEEVVSGSFGNRNHFAAFLEMTLPFAAAYAWGALLAARSGRLGSIPAALGATGALALAATMGAAVLASMSKMGLLSMAASLCATAAAAIGAVGPRRQRYGWRLALAVFTALLFFALPSTELIQQFGVVRSTDPTEGRLPIWGDALHLASAYPFFGSGLGTFYPALLRYQTWGLELAWTAAHNDYLQFLAELGSVGVLFPLVVLVGATSQAFRRVHTAPARSSRALALGCAGSLTAALCHSMAEFNAYVLANALTMAWVAGMACGVPTERSAEPSQATASTGKFERRVRLVAFAGACALAAYGCAWHLFLDRHLGATPSEPRFCTFGICDTDAWLGAALPAAGDKGAVAVQRAALERSPADPVRWDDLGEAFQQAGEADRARIAFSRALDLAPRSPSVLLRVADYWLDTGDSARALPLMGQALRWSEQGSLDRAVFADLAYRKLPMDEVLRGVVPDARSSRALLASLMSEGQVDASAVVWEWALANGQLDEGVASRYTSWMLQQGRPAQAQKAWARFTRGRAAGYADGNRLFNSGFEAEPSGSPFDWRISSTPGVRADINADAAHSGARALRLQFDGSKNVGAVGVEQALFLEAGRYRLQASLRSQDVTTDEGVRLEVVGDGVAAPGQTVQTEAVRGTTEWTSVRVEFEVPERGRVVTVRVVRHTSLRFDSLVRGVVWVDDVSVAAVAGRDSTVASR